MSILGSLFASTVTTAVGGIFKSGNGGNGEADLRGTFVGKALDALGLPSDYSARLGFGVTSEGWLKRGSALPDPLLQIDWTPQMPFGLPPEYVIEMSVPVSNCSADGVFVNGSREYTASFSDTGALTILFYEDRLMTVTNWLMGWRSLIQNSNGTFNSPSVYKQTVFLSPTDVKGNALATMKIIGCWPTQIPEYAFSSGNSNPVQLSVTFQCDKVIIESASNTGYAGAIGKAMLGKVLNGSPFNIGSGVLANAAQGVIDAIF